MSKDRRPILIVDAMNLFQRSWSAYPTMSSHGYQMGGCIGFLKTLKRITIETQPSRICVAWEGGGSLRRRSLFSEYKLNRKPEKLNRFYGDDIPESEENRKHQLMTLIGMAKHIPVCQIYASDCEGDDIIAHLCCGPLKNEQKVIVSSDKDLYQLLNNDTRMYSLHKKITLCKEDILEEFRITADNFALAKALCGDPGDNVPGVKGLGFKTVAKLFPFLSTTNNVLLQDVFDYSYSHIDESKVYKKIVEAKDDVKRNWKLMYLDGSMLSANQISSIDHTLSTFKPKVNKMGLLKILLKEGINDFHIDDFFYAFKCIEDIELSTGNNTK